MIRPPFPGTHQEQNLRTVLLTLQKINIPLHSNLVIEGITATKELTGMRARLEEYDYPRTREKNMKLVLDVAHNPDAFRSLKEYFIEKGIKPIIIAGFAKDKDITAILNEIKQFASLFISVAANSHRAIPSNELAVLSNNAGIETVVSTDTKAGIDLAIASGKDKEVLLLAGSHFVVGDFLKSMEQ
jgi:folylpolyglutamate synthase/dihydropteroate synthase